MGDSGSVEQSIAHHISHRNLSDKRKSNACNVSVLSSDTDFAATLYGISTSGGHHSHEHINNSSGLSVSRSSLVTSEQQHHSGESKRIYSKEIC